MVLFLLFIILFSFFIIIIFTVRSLLIITIYLLINFYFYVLNSIFYLIFISIHFSCQVSLPWQGFFRLKGRRANKSSDDVQRSRSILIQVLKFYVLVLIFVRATFMENFLNIFIWFGIFVSMEFVSMFRFCNFLITPCKAEQPLRGMELNKKKHRMIKAYKNQMECKSNGMLASPCIRTYYF